jgi:hypothetical protein
LDGLPCPGAPAGESSCSNGKLNFDEVGRFLGQTSEEWQSFIKRLEPTQSKQVKPVLAAAAAVLPSPESILIRLRGKIEASFNVRCPNPACDTVVGLIENCNAAYCESCRTLFCYLCLNFVRKPESPGLDTSATDMEAVHTHTRRHSQAYYEHRDAYSGKVPNSARGETYREFIDDDPKQPYTFVHRYQWVNARRLQHEILNVTEVPPEAVTHLLLEQLRPLLQKNKMWPYPAGKATDVWIAEVNADADLKRRNKIVLIENEFIFKSSQIRALTERGPQEDLDQPSIRDQLTLLKREVKLLETALKDLGVTSILSSLDVIPFAEDRARSVVDGIDFPPHRVQSIIPIVEGAANYMRLDPRFVAISRGLQIYQVINPGAYGAEAVPNLVWSGLAPESMNYWDAAGWSDVVSGSHPGYCAQRGGRLPSRAEFRVLQRAMQLSGLMGGMLGNTFWMADSDPDSSSPLPPITTLFASDYLNVFGQFVTGLRGMMSSIGPAEARRLIVMAPYGKPIISGERGEGNQRVRCVIPTE